MTERMRRARKMSGVFLMQVLSGGCADCGSQKEIDKTVNTVYIVNIQKEQMKGMME